MLLFYFSGTGNSRYISELINKKMGGEVHSIEECIDFGGLMNQYDIIGFCYPIYGSRMPRIMKEFINKQRPFLHRKKVAVFCTQFLFSGDGARSFVDLFPKNYLDIIYAEHFFMPNNVCNLPPLPVVNGDKNNKYFEKAEKRASKVCKDISEGIVFRRGFNPISRILGIEGELMPLLERKAISSVKIRATCNRCGKCVHICPMKNLEEVNGDIRNKSNCTLCYRCVNACPQRAITAFLHGKVKRQYKGVIDAALGYETK